MDEKAPYVKEHNGTSICFADTVEQACNALKRTNLTAGDEEKLANGHLMLFGVEDWSKSITDLKGSFKSANNQFSRIEVFGCEMNSKAQADFADSLVLNDVKHFDLDNTKLEPEGAYAIFKKIAASNSIEKLNLQGSVEAKGVLEKINEAMAADSNAWKPLRELDFKINNIKPDGAAIIADMVMKFVPTEEDTKLDLFYNEFGAEGANALAHALAGNTTTGPCVITHLDLCCNNIGDAGAIAIGEALRSNTYLKSLKLALNNIGNAGAIKIFESLFAKKNEPRNTTLEILDISANVMKEEKDNEVAKKVEENPEEKAKNLKKYDDELIKLINKEEELTDAEITLQAELQEKRAKAAGVENVMQTRPLLTAISSVFQRANTLKEFDFTGIEFDVKGWESMADALVTTKHVVGRTDPMIIKFSIVDLMSEENLNNMNKRIWDDAKKDEFRHIDWRRRDDGAAAAAN